MISNRISINPKKLDLSLGHLRKCSDKNIQELVSSFEKIGQINPIIAGGDSRHMIVIDGFKRQQAAEIIGMEKVEVSLLPISGSQMKGYVYHLNQHNNFSFLDECALIYELVDKDGLLQKDVAIMLQHHKSWVSRRLSTFRCLDRQVVSDIRLGLIPVGATKSLARLQRCNQVDMSAAIQRDNLKMNEINSLIDLWFKAETPEAKSYLIKNPRKALELANKKNEPKYDHHIPLSARKWNKSVLKLKQIASILKQQSLKGFGAISAESERILSQNLLEMDKICQDAISCSYKTLEKYKGGGGNET